MKKLSNDSNLTTKPATGRSIGQNLKLTTALIKKAAAHDRVLSGGAK